MRSTTPSAPREGDAEDREGRPFVGPAGRLLDALLAQAQLQRPHVYITNAVKHFSWEPRGKRRLHKRPQLRHIKACGVWLNAEGGQRRFAAHSTDPWEDFKTCQRRERSGNLPSLGHLACR